MDTATLIAHAKNLANLAESTHQGGNEAGARTHLTKLLELLTAELPATTPAEPEKPTQDGQG